MIEQEQSKKQTVVNTDDEISLKELFLKLGEWKHYLFSRWKTIVIACCIGAVLGLAYSILKKTTYEASLTFVLDEQKSGGSLGSYAGIASQFGINLGGISGQDLFTGDNIMEFLKSRKIIQGTLLTPVQLEGKTELLVDRYVRFNELDKKWSKKPQLKHFKFIPDTTDVFLQDSLMAGIYKKILKDNLTIEKPDKKLDIIALTVESEDELFSKAFAEQLIKNVSDFYVQTRTKKSEDNVRVLTKQVDSVRRELDAAIGGVAAATEANPNANKAFQSLRVPSQKRTIDVQANTAIFSELVKQKELAKMNLRNDKPLIQVLDRPILPLEKDKVGKMKGIILGGFIAGFLAVLFLLGKHFVRSIIEDE